MKKKLFTLCLGLGIALGASNVSAGAEQCFVQFQSCMASGTSEAVCWQQHDQCMISQGWN